MSVTERPMLLTASFNFTFDLGEMESEGYISKKKKMGLEKMLRHAFCV